MQLTPLLISVLLLLMRYGYIILLLHLTYFFTAVSLESSTLIRIVSFAST